MTLVGGLRARMIRESMYHMVYDSLDALGWFDPARRHLPIKFTGRTYTNEETIELNTIVLVDEGTTDRETGLGELEIEQQWLFYIDIYAESDSIGRDLAHDIRDILAGRHTTAGRTRSIVEIYDYRMATPAVVGIAQLEDVVIDRAHDFPKPWQKHWFSCRVTVVDVYGPTES